MDHSQTDPQTMDAVVSAVYVGPPEHKTLPRGLGPCPGVWGPCPGGLGPCPGVWGPQLRVNHCFSLLLFKVS